MITIPHYGIQLVRDGSTRAESKNVDTAAGAAEIARAVIGVGADREHFVVLLLNARNSVTGTHTVSIGTLTASLVHPREVFKAAILGNAASVIIAHNHPSGDISPSPEDKEATKRLVRAGELLGIAVLDHVIVSDDGHYSFREGGLL